MSGRAGRRGKDDRGIVIQILDEQMEPDVAKNMIYGASDALFRLGDLIFIFIFFHFYLLSSLFRLSFLVNLFVLFLQRLFVLVYLSPGPNLLVLSVVMISLIIYPCFLSIAHQIVHII